MRDKYGSYAELARHEIPGADYRVRAVERRGSPLLVIAPHGGRIEIGTSELAALIAADDYSLFAFEGLKRTGSNRDLHITSHRFDHPDCLALLGRCATAVTVHGCRGEGQIYVGGLDTVLVRRLTRRLVEAGWPACADGHPYPGRHPTNICNRARRGCGVQLEFTFDLRQSGIREQVAPVIREVIADYLTELEYGRAALYC